MNSLTDQEKALEAQLAQASTDDERGHLHAALAVCACQSLAYRRMNFHEKASAQALANRSRPLKDACSNYDAAIEAFNNCEDARGLALLRLAQPIIVTELGAQHLYALQVTETLAGRLKGDQTLAERLALRQWLVARYTAMFGVAHTATCQQMVHLAQLLADTGAKQEAIANYELAINGFVSGPWPHEAVKALPHLAVMCREAGQAQRTELLERQLYGSSLMAHYVVRKVFLHRQPQAAKHFNAQALLSGATYFPTLSSITRAAVDGASEAASCRAQPTDDDSAEAAFAIAIYKFGSLYLQNESASSVQPEPTEPADWVLRAMERLDNAERCMVQQPATGCAFMHDDEGKFENDERERQWGCFEKLFTDQLGKH